MKIKIKLLLLFFAAGKTIYSQQNLFNVPSLEITGKKEHFAQYQVNITDQFQNNITYNYGLGKGWEIGLNILALNINPKLNAEVLSFNDHFETNAPLCPLLMINAQKEFKLSKIFKVSSGFQLGMNASPDIASDRLAIFAYANSKLNLADNKLQLVNGLYYGNKNYLGCGTPINVMNGVEYSLLKKFHLMGDVFWGNNYISDGVIGGVYYITDHFTVSAGYQFLTLHSKSSNGCVVELTLF